MKRKSIAKFNAHGGSARQMAGVIYMAAFWVVYLIAAIAQFVWMPFAAIGSAYALEPATCNMGLRYPQTHDGPTNRGSNQFGAINAVRSFQIDRQPGAMLELMILRLNGSLVVSGGTASGTALGRNPHNLVQKIEVLAASAGRYPGGVLKSLSPQSLVSQRLFQTGQIVTDSALTGAAGTFTLDTPYYLYFSQPSAPRAFDFALPMSEYQSLTLRVTNGSRDTQFTGNDRVFDFTGALYDLIDKREIQVEGSPVKHVIYESDDLLLVPGANKRLGYNAFPVTDGALMDLHCYAETTNQVLADTIVNKITAKYAGVPFFSAFSADIRRFMRERYFDSSQTLTGIYDVGYNAAQLSKGAIPLAQPGDVALEFDVNNPGGANIDRLWVHSKRVIWPELFLGSAGANAS